VLNARHHEQEAYIVAEAGVPGAVTIATNMAGRGTDIQLGGNVDMRVGGAMAARSAEAHARSKKRARSMRAEDGDSRKKGAGRRRPLRHRHRTPRKPPHRQPAARPLRPSGRPRPLKFFLSLEDDLMRIFGSDRLDSHADEARPQGRRGDRPSVDQQGAGKAQQKVEARNFDIRKNLLKFDDVMNDQRKAIFDRQRIERAGANTSGTSTSCVRSSTCAAMPSATR
jgi:preprotein translocase subunit SecA